MHCLESYQLPALELQASIISHKHSVQAERQVCWKCPLYTWPNPNFIGFFLQSYWVIDELLISIVNQTDTVIIPFCKSYHSSLGLTNNNIKSMLSHTLLLSPSGWITRHCILQHENNCDFFKDSQIMIFWALCFRIHRNFTGVAF